MKTLNKILFVAEPIVAIILLILFIVITFTSCKPDPVPVIPGAPTPVITNNYRIVDTDQDLFYDEEYLIPEPAPGAIFYGQDAHYIGNRPSYSNNGNGTITDNVTGLMWQEEMGEQLTLEEAFSEAESLRLGGYADWRVPTIKELFSLIHYRGVFGKDTSTTKVFINTDFFDQPWGDESNPGERFYDAQLWSSTEYTSTTMGGNATMFGVNFVDGRIKGYPKFKSTGVPSKMYVRFVRLNVGYGKNDYLDMGNGTIVDQATALQWQQSDDGLTRNWVEALEYCETLILGGYEDWRLPNIKELQSIVDYNRSPDFTSSAAIDPIFDVTSIYEIDGSLDYPYYWSGTTLDEEEDDSTAMYIAFGEAFGKNGPTWWDTHGAGAARSDPKLRFTHISYPSALGPQLDIRFVNNYTRCVRDYK